MEGRNTLVIVAVVIAICQGCVPELDLARRPGVSVTMSSESGRPGFSFAGSKAVDGIYVPPRGARLTHDFSSLAHTRVDQSPWIQINFGMRRCITGVKIWNRSYSAELLARFRNALITVSDYPYGTDSLTTRCAYTAGAQPAVRLHQCPKVMCGQYVRVTALNVNTVLNLYEIEVHGW